MLIDDITVLRGFIDERLVPEEAGADYIQVVGRDRAGRLVDESAPGLIFAGLDMFTIARQLVSPWYPTVVASNARNRLVTRGRGVKAKAGGEPIIIKNKKIDGSRLEPGRPDGTRSSSSASRPGI